MAVTRKRLGTVPTGTRKVSVRSQAQAAKTRMLLDEQLGEKTPPYIKRLAKAAPLKG